MKWLFAIVKERGLLVDTISYIYDDKWQEDRIHPGLVGRVYRQLDDGLGLPVFGDQQPQSCRIQITGLLFLHMSRLSLLSTLATELALVTLDGFNVKRQQRLIRRLLRQQ